MNHRLINYCDISEINENIRTIGYGNARVGEFRVKRSKTYFPFNKDPKGIEDILKATLFITCLSRISNSI